MNVSIESTPSFQGDAASKQNIPLYIYLNDLKCCSVAFFLLLVFY